MSCDVTCSHKVFHLKEPWPEAAVQKDVKPKYLKEATCVVVGSDPRAAGLVGMDHLWVHTQEGLDDHILQRGGRGEESEGVVPTVHVGNSLQCFPTLPHCYGRSAAATG